MALNSRQGPTLLAVMGGVGSLLAAVACFLPWLEVVSGFGAAGVSGLDDGGDGLIVLLATVIALLAAVWAAMGRQLLVPGLLIALAGIISGGVFAWDYLEVGRRIEDATAISDLATVRRGAGLYVLALGSALLVVAGFALLVVSDRYIVFQDDDEDQ